ncbi:hypothetical protein Nepgr_025359 [Nepenthes gracilis]|uniref:Uncharacterized protein n=1 Tax=Nepenthes gracilis TaxID=150966 RepID=A0AAD3T6J8_NEPGR|nr:hypothetical protein Nepgr_025359 [Nepenthes gracilis]
MTVPLRATPNRGIVVFSEENKTDSPSRASTRKQRRESTGLATSAFSNPAIFQLLDYSNLAVFNSTSGERLSGLCFPPLLDVSRATVEIPSLAVSIQVDGFGHFDAEDSGLPCGSLICDIPGNRSAPEQDSLPVAKNAINRLQMGLPYSMDSDVPAGNPHGSSRSRVVHQLSQGGFSPSEKTVDCGPLGTHTVCPVPPSISVEDVVAGTNTPNPVSGPSPSASSLVSWASIVGQQQNQVVQKLMYLLELEWQSLARAARMLFSVLCGVD